MDDLSDLDTEELGMEDGTFDRDNHSSYRASFGSSVDLDDLTDEQLEAYELGYSMGAEDYDLSDEE